MIGQHRQHPGRQLSGPWQQLLNVDTHPKRGKTEALFNQVSRDLAGAGLPGWHQLRARAGAAVHEGWQLEQWSDGRVVVYESLPAEPQPVDFERMSERMDQYRAVLQNRYTISESETSFGRRIEIHH